MHNFARFVLAGSVMSIAAFAAEPAAGGPWDSSAVNVESGLLWEIGSGTPFAYRLVPTQLSWRSKEFLEYDLSDGSVIVVRHRLTLIGTWVQSGPESYYVAVAGSPSIEWWNRAGTWSLFTGRAVAWG